ncbi:MAG TPA: Holliday junction resolvase [Halobacteria archaeon]|nr:Holliday junction resolvase [Halobacteria archaeon]
MHRGRKGTDSERELVNMLWRAGFAAIRSPASGAATKNPLPDIIAGNGKRYLSIEVKSSSKDRFYIKKDDIKDLVTFSKRFGAEPYLGVKFNGEKWVFAPVDPLDGITQILSVTKDGNVRIDIQEVRQRWMDFDELIGISRQTRL